ncbi:MAG: DUF5305 domain-containing protein [Desulfurococcales archaeon]|nr:DUF5305 domain-containing protein [Desulfurococcales archaeon]
MLLSEGRIRALHRLLFSASIALVAFAALLGIGAFSSQPYKTVEEVSFRATASSRFNVYFSLEPNEIYEKESIGPGSGLPVYLSLVREAVVEYTYSINRPPSGGSYRLAVILEHPDGWAKVYEVREGNLSGAQRVSEKLSLKVPLVVDYMDNLSSLVGASKLGYTVRIVSTVSPELGIGDPSGAALVHEVSLSIDKARNRITINGNTTKSMVIEELEERPVRVFIAGMDVGTARVVSALLGGSGALSLLVSAWIHVSNRGRETEAEKLERKYRGLIISSTSVFEPGKTRIMEIASADELVKAARLLERPIIKLSWNGKDTVYLVADKDVVYMLSSRGSRTGTGGGSSE